MIGRAGLLVAILGLSGCAWFSARSPSAEEQALRDMHWSFGEDQIELVIQADPQLNRFADQSHSLLLVVVQAPQANVFSEAIGGPGQLSHLLLKDSAPPGMLGLTRLFIEPGANRRVRLPRLEGARYIGLAGGYSHLDPPRSARLYRIGVDIDKQGFWSSTYTARPQPLRIDLLLGADGILQAPQSRLLPVALERPLAGEVPLAPAP